jgi:amino acid adenylation domain-containing protein
VVDNAKRIAKLSPKQLLLLEQKLRRAAPAVAAEAIIPRGSRHQPAQLSFAQERLWFLDQLRPGNPAYNLSLTIPFKGQAQDALMERSINEIIRRHEALRTTFQTHNGKPIQVIHSEGSIALSVYDVRNLKEPSEQAQLTSEFYREMQRPFDLDKGPLIRAFLLHMTGTDHVLFILMHHIVSDGWSLNVFIRELSLIYDAYQRGVPSPLPELSIQYADFAMWQREYMQGELAEAHLRYWRSQLDGAPEILNLPLDRPMPGSRSFQGALQYLPLKSSTLARVKSLAQAENTTLFITLLAVFKALLHLYTGQDDIVVGSLIANRNRQEIEALIGFFVNSLVLRTKVAGGLTFREILKRVQNVTLDAYAHQDFPFDRLVAELLSSRDQSRNPLFQVMFTMQDAGAPAGANQTVDEAAWEQQISAFRMSPVETWVKFDLALTAIDSGPGVVTIWEYRTDIFNHETISKMAAHFETLLEALMAEPDRPLSQLENFTFPRRRQEPTSPVSFVERRPQAPYIHELIEAQVERSPEATALIWGDRTMSYRELNQKANNLAFLLKAQGVGPDKRVGVHIERSPEMIIAILAILKAGGAYVPLDAAYPVERLAFMARNAEIALTLTEERLLPNVARMTLTHAAPILALDSCEEMLAGHEDENPKCAVAPENLAYVIYTSGSTGKPKGVMIPHSAIANHMQWMLSSFDFNSADIILQRTPISFDASVWELFAPLMAGARMLLSTSHVSSYDSIPDEIIRHNVTVVQLVPTLLRAMLRDAKLSGCHSLRYVFCGGEPLDTELVKSFRQQQKADLYNLYGPTEATIDATWWKCEEDCEQATAPIGRPVNNIQVYVLDSALRPLQGNDTGHLYIGGEALARGYINQPDVTAENFIPSPFATAPGERLYRTGDMARVLAGGALEFIARSDHQVKVRGFRIELAEVETVLARHPDLRSVCVLDQRDGFGDARLVAYIVFKPGAMASVNDLRSFLQGLLPEHMIPAAFVSLDHLPLMPNGKLDRKALSQVDIDRPLGRAASEAPQNYVEEKLVDIWKEVLGREHFGVTDNFFAIGGHSLLATQAISRIRDTFEVELPLSQIFETPTISGLGLNIQERMGQAVHYPDASAPNGSEQQRLLEKIDQFSEEQINALLFEMRQKSSDTKLQK